MGHQLLDRMLAWLEPAAPYCAALAFGIYCPLSLVVLGAIAAVAALLAVIYQNNGGF